jgi:hypothetical protein
MKSTRLAFVTDIHHGADHGTKQGSSALRLLEEFRRFAAEAKADAVIDMGDRISDVGRERDLALEREIANAFAAFDLPRFHIVGNHDRDHLSVADNEQIFGQDLKHRWLDLGSWRIVFWQADTLIRWPGGFAYSEIDVTWLAATVAAANRPLLIVSHVPVSSHSQVGNYYFEANPEHAGYPQSARIRAILRSASVPVAWIAGHVHWNTVTKVDGIPHLTLQSLTETFTTGGEAAGSFGLLELSEQIDWRVFGRDPFAFRMEATASLERWRPPMPPFDQVPGLKERMERRKAAAAAAAE